MSGRGVGLDVVRTSLASVRGRVEVQSEPGSGSEFRLSVPITLAVLPCLLVEAAGRRFGIPMHSVVSAEAAGWAEDHVEGQVVIRVRDMLLPVSDLDRRRAMDAGADAYLVKGDLDQRALLEVVGRLLGLAVRPAGGVAR